MDSSLCPAILERDEVEAIVEQIERIHHGNQSLYHSPEHRAVPGGPASVLIFDHPKVLDVLHEIIATRKSSFRNTVPPSGLKKGRNTPGIHKVADRNKAIQFSMVSFQQRPDSCRNGAQFVFELTDISKKDGATHFIAGSHKANFPMHSDHMSLESKGSEVRS